MVSLRITKISPIGFTHFVRLSSKPKRTRTLNQGEGGVKNNKTATSARWMRRTVVRCTELISRGVRSKQSTRGGPKLRRPAGSMRSATAPQTMIQRGGDEGKRGGRTGGA